MANIASVIDHTLLRADATPQDIIQLCNEAREYDFAAVCVNSTYTQLVAKELRGTSIATCVVIGFPLGASSTFAKTAEAVSAIADGANELDMVINIGAVKSGAWRIVEDDIAAVVKAAGTQTLVKVILETCLLTDAEKELACLVAQKAGAAFVKTSTGFSVSGATEKDVSLMKRVVPNMQVKASGGIRTLNQARAFLAIGASRLGCSSSVSIVKGDLE